MSIPGDMVIELNFVPDWARRPAKESSYTRYEASRAGGRDGRENKRRPRETLDKSDNNRRYAKHGSRNTSRPDRVATASPPRLHETVGQGRSATPLARSLPACPPEYDNVGRPQSAGQGAAAGKRPQGSRKRPIPVKVTFIPESRGLKPLAARLRRSGRAYPLLEVAALFISKPDFYAVKHEVEPDGTGTAVLFLYQCAVCQAVFLDCNLTVAHALNRHLDLFYAREETTVEPPKGTFTAVARCPLSGELLGPPNYHQFNERLAELH
ncbi:MAG: hypothetical protein HYV36_06245, partial [Lentisphaerae bacterium]|nr:hypothetical protein [Lentisphaerota bacterium]